MEIDMFLASWFNEIKKMVLNPSWSWAS